MKLYKEENEDWDDWLKQLETKLSKKGFGKFNQKIHREDYAFWKKYDEKYQIGIFVYDFRKYLDRNPNANYVGLSFHCHILDEETFRMEVDREHPTLKVIEEISSKFYESMKEFF